MDKFDLYRDIATRTGGDVYVGVVGPVRTGKSTIIKQFMEKLVVGGIENKDVRARAVDEIPQSADGKTIMTTQPKFVPADAVRVVFHDNLAVNMRLIDCVGYMVDGALGGAEDGRERMVRTPWSDEEMPFSEAAALGTDKVIREHSTVAIAVTTDGSFTDLPREAYEPAEERVVEELKLTGKPFVVVLNSARPEAEETEALRSALQEKYGVSVSVVNALAMDEDDIARVMEDILLEFGVRLIDFDLPHWVQALTPDDDVVREILAAVRDMGDRTEKMKDYALADEFFEGKEFWKLPSKVELDAGKGRIYVAVEPKDDVFFKVASRECGMELEDDVLPTMEEMVLEEPEIIRQGQQYGVKLKASAPSLHIMKVDVETEVRPIVGSEQQSSELVDAMLGDFENDKQAIWDTNIFGRSLSSLVADGINNKLMSVPPDAEQKLRKTLGRIVNEGKGGVICILL